MDHSIKNLINIKNNINSNLQIFKINKSPKIIAVSKTFKLDKILPLIDYGHLHYGENKVQEALDKWSKIKDKYPNLKLHLIGKLQTNKVKFAVQIFDYIHSVDSEKLAKKISDEQNKLGKKIKVFLQVNIGEEIQKSGINKNELKNLINFSKNIDLDVLGLMCIPPQNLAPDPYFEQMSILNKSYNFSELSMGMSADYIKAVKNYATYLRVGSGIFGQRS